VFAEWETTYLEQSVWTWQCVSDVRNSFYITLCLSHSRPARIAPVSIHAMVALCGNHNSTSLVQCHMTKKIPCVILELPLKKKGMRSKECSIYECTYALIILLGDE
jgi:hypothetical protein